ncbi:hypothetical protein [Fodinicola acaciae]|uniref:hypothetical protein n=1 Tax=Fodinicola acaciae TaxID=2681555 RepID=UPI0013D80964|nr:hypothetical protein [Fodinicola acaciae]
MAGFWIALAGVALLAYTGWCWAGRSTRARRWSRRTSWDSMILGLFPGLGLVLFASGVAAMLPEPAVGFAAPLILVAFAVFGMGMIYLVFKPRWWGPRWYRRMPASRRHSDLDDPVTAVRASLVGGRGVDSQQAARRAVTERFGAKAQAVAAYDGGYVRDPDRAERDHALARRGTVSGRVEVFAEGVVFAADRTEDSLREDPTVLVLPSAAVTGVRVVPARAGADGRPRRGVLHRSPFRRLVIDTAADSYVFEVAFGKANQAATTIQSTMRLAR